MQQVQQRDNNCVARGKMWKPNCRDCPKGKTKPEKISLSVEVTPGMRAGERVSFESVADEKPGMEAGDLHFVIIQVDVNPVLFTRDGDRLYKTMEIPLVDALVSLFFYFNNAFCIFGAYWFTTHFRRVHYSLIDWV